MEIKSQNIFKIYYLQWEASIIESIDHVETVKYLTEAGTAINTRDNDGYSQILHRVHVPIALHKAKYISRLKWCLTCFFPLLCRLVSMKVFRVLRKVSPISLLRSPTLLKVIPSVPSYFFLEKILKRNLKSMETISPQHDVQNIIRFFGVSSIV